MRLLKLFSVLFAVVAAIAFLVTVFFQAENRDTEGPVISMDADTIEISVGDPEENILSGVTAQDAKDGDVTVSLVVESLSNFVADGERIASIAAFDSDNHVTKVTRTVHYRDYTVPHFSMSAPFSFALGTELNTISSVLSAIDCLDGDVTRRIVCSSAEGNALRTDLPGSYRMEFSVSNSAGDIEKFTATVEIYDTREDIPNITLTDSLIYLSVGSGFDPLQYLKTITVDGVGYQMVDGNMVRPNVEGEVYDLNNIVIDNPVNTEAPGWYEVSYTVTSSIGNQRTARLLVCIE